VDVSVDGGILTVTAQRSERTEHDAQCLSTERFTGSYMRRLSLGQDIEPTTSLPPIRTGRPVAARAKPRRIEVTAGAPLIEPIDSSDQHTTT
jgi:HSP20 family protein